MSGVAVLRHLLANNGAVTAVVPATRIFAGDAAIKTAFPLLIVTQISGVPVNYIHNGSRIPQIDRVQVSALATSYATVKQLMGLIFAACPSQKGTVNGVTVIDIVPDFQGPDLFNDDPVFYSQAQDFLVRWVR